jgi:hypothetical protein
MIRKIVLLTFMLLLSLQASAAETVKVFRGSGNTTTATFTVDSPWLLDWRVDGDYPQSVALDVTLIEAPSGRYVGRILRTKRIGNGLQLFEEPGQYQLRISSTLARWTLKIQQIEPEEVELYTPRATK